MWFIFALLALLFWSGSDLFSKIGSRPNDKLSHWKMVISVGFVMGLHAVYEIFVGGVEINFDIIVKYLPASALYILSMILGYVGLRYIELSVSSPICNSSGGVVSLIYILCFAFTGAFADDVPSGPLAWLQYSAIALIVFGVVLLGIVEQREDQQIKIERQKRENIKYQRSFLALLLPVLYCLLDAAGTFADSIILNSVNEESANVAYELTFLAMGVFALIYVIIRRRGKGGEELSPYPSDYGFWRRLWCEKPKFIAACSETAGQFFYVFALNANPVQSAPIISAYCVASVVWSRIFLKEKLSWKHYLAIAVTAAGIIILGAFDEA